MRSCFIVIMGIFILASLAVSATIHIPGDYPTIQAGIDAAVNGDTVLVANGTYTGTGNKNLDFLGKAIVVKSENGPENCIIDCENDGRGFYFHLNETNASVLDGFTITNGHVSERGGAIFLENSSPLIYNCAINSNTAQISGGGISCMSYSNPLIYSCEITENIAEYNGGGIQCAINSNPSINDCLIANNTAYNHGGGIDSWDSSPIISDCIISENLTVGDVSNGGGIHCDGNSEVNVSYSLIINNEAYEGGGLDSWLSNTQITNCTISGNTARLNAGGIRFAFNSSSDVLNTLIEGNENGGIIISDSPDMSITYCDFYNNEQFSFGGNTVPAGLGELVSININGDSCDVFNNIFENPEFYSLSGDSAFYLTFNSSCIDAGNPDSIYFDPDGTIADIGAYYFDQTGLNGALSGFISAGTYHIIGDISVNEGYSLEIDAGTQFLFDGDYSFNINGCLLAIGNEIDSIIFKANEGIPQWEGIDFNDSADDSCRMEYCKITGSNSSGIEIISANISLKNCSVDGNWGLNGGGIKCQNANPTIENCLISNNESGSDGGGLYCDNSNPYIIGSTINSNSANNWAGGILLDESSPAISSTTVSDNSAGVNGGGVVLGNYSKTIIQNFNIKNNNGKWGGGKFF
ncbi:MAG: right-handed parallel beta-helix repeat-containing protein [Candidatus Marinimicrobia bacterium]|nr:right-handed parallel beta-helix repeat-containing protein [Candidatus Neomarinimicrobiota bacterium]